MLSPGTELGQYKIGAPLGAGGMGEVYRATDSRLDRDVAIKVLPPQFAQDQARLARFEREAKAVAALSHPNILAIHDFDTEQGQTFAVMELLEGETLRGRLAHGAIPWRKAVEIAIAIADGLSAAHAKGIIHRDLKPENIFLTTPGWVKILDFGLARFELPTLPSGDTPTGTYHPAQTEVGTILGTVGYMSPEQVRGKEADAKSDIFSLGCLLHEMVTGQRAFSRETSVETLTAILHDEPPDLADSGKKIPLELQRIIQHCLEKNPASRFHSAHDLAFALRAIQPDAKTQEQSASKRVATWVATALALAAIAVLALWLTNRRPTSVRDRAFESVAVLPFENATGDPKAEPLSDGIADHLSINLSQLRDRDFKVTPFTSASRFRGPKIDLKSVGSTLGVQAIVTGKLYQDGENLSINVALSDAGADSLIWGQQYRGKRSEILALQDEIAKGLVAHLGLKLSDADEQRLLKRHTEDPTAYMLYQVGMYHWHKFREESIRTAIDCFERALKVDPKFARAYEGLGRCYGVQDGFSMRASETQPKAKAALQKALELDNSLAEAHGGMGNYYMSFEHNWPAAERSLKEALRLNPRLADAHHLYGFYLAATGQTAQAIAELKTAKELAPQTAIHSAGLAQAYFCAHQYKEQLAESQWTLELAANFPLAYYNMGEAYALQGKYDQAAEVLQKQLAIEKKLAGPLGMLGFTYGRWGKSAEANEVLQEITDLSQHQYFSGFERARIYAGLGDKDKAIHWLEKAYEERDWGIAWLKVDPTLDSLRAEPRFGDLLQRMGLADKSTIEVQGIQSVAVLPLENVGDDPKTEFLSDGIADQIINSLSQVRRQNLKVRPFRSVSRYKKQKPDLQTIARELNVQAIVTGSLHQQGEDLSIGIELVDARDDSVLWNKRYPGKLSGILDLQDQIARDVAANLRLHLTGDEEQRLTKRHTQNPEAYLLYREANFHLNKFTPEGIANSIAKCQQAIEKDPKFATAHAALAGAHLLMGSLYQGPRQTFAEARKHVAQALALEENEPDALSVLATSYMFLDWDWPAAEREFKRSIESDPNIGLTRNLYGFCLAATGRLPEALASIQSGRQLDPLAAPRINEVAMCRIWLRQYDEAITEANKALELDPNFPLAYTHLAAAYVSHGQPDQAIDKMKAAIAAGQRHPGVTGMLAYAYAAAGQTAEAQKILQQLTGLAQVRFGIAIHVSRIHAALGDKDQAFEWLQKARDEREPGVIWLKVDPTFDSLRSDDRFDAILQEMRLSDKPTPTRSVSDGFSAPIDTLAVLPFDNQSMDAEAGYLGDDITYSLTDSLARVRELKVRPYSSAARFKTGSFDTKAAGRELQVQAVLKGTIQKRGDEIVIDVELVHVGEDRRLWGDRYPGKLADRLALQQKIIQEVPEKLRLSLTSQEKQALAKLPTPSLKAHELYIQGRLECNKRTVPGLEKSMDLYRQAIDQDQKFALAWAGLADAYFTFPIISDTSPKDAMLKAKAAAIKALEIDDQLVEAHAVLAAIASAYEWDWSEADRRFQRAMALNPNYATLRYRYGQHLTTLGRFQEAQVHSACARELDPLTLIIRSVTGRHFYYARQYDAAIEQYRKVLDTQPNFWVARLFLGNAYAQQRRYDEAIVELERARQLPGGNLEAWAGLGHVYALMGKTTEARQVLAEFRELSKQRYIPPNYFAIIHAGLGEKEQALAELEKGFEERNFFFALLHVEPMFDSLKNEPRFQKLVADMKFPPK